MGVAASIADDNDVVIEIPRRVDRGRDTDINGATGYNNRVDSA